MWQHHISVNRCCRLREDRFLTQSKVMEKCRAKTEIIKVISDQRTKPSRMTRKGADGGCGLMKMRQVLPLWHTGIHHGLSCLSGSFLLLSASPVTSRRRSEGIPVAGQKWLQHNWSALCTWPGENQHECTCACARAYTAMQNTITGKGKCSLQWTSVPPATPGIPPSPCYHRGALQKVELVWLTSSPPVFPDQPFPPLLKGMNEPLPSEHPPHPLLRASSRVWRSYANTCASKLSTSSCCSSLWSFRNKPTAQNRSYCRCWAMIKVMYLCMMRICSNQP